MVPVEGLLSDMNHPIYTLLIIYFISNTFVFRYQKTTLSISRAVMNGGYYRVQTALTPSWIGLVGWCNKGLAVLVTILLFIKFGWPWCLAFLAYVFVGTSIVDTFTPLPSHKQCFALIEKKVKNSIMASNDKEEKELLEKLLLKINKVRKDCRIEQK